MTEALVGLGWPGDPGLSMSSRPPVEGHPASPARAALAGRPAATGLGWPVTGPVPKQQASRDQASAERASAERVSRALAGVSRETLSGAKPAAVPDPAAVLAPRGPVTVTAVAVGPGISPGVTIPPAVSAGQARMSEGPGESEDDMSMATGPEGAADTPIARAARAAVVARSGGDQWPRPGACRILTVANQKGGVGKTTSTVNLAASLAIHGARVLVVDLDPQGNASTALDVDHHAEVRSVYHVLVDGQPIESVVSQVAGFEHLYCVPATIDLAGAEIELVPLVARESRLARAVAQYDSSGLDYILIDCPPSLGLLTVNALVAAPEVLIPIQCEYYALEGLEQLLRTADLVRSHLNPGLTLSTILLTMYDGRTRLAAQVADEVR